MTTQSIGVLEGISMYRFACPFVFLSLLVVALSANADVSDRDKMKFFETDIRPVLVQYCYKCHSAGAEKIGGKLYVDSREGMLRGGESGPVIKLGNPDESLLIVSLRGHGDLEMPPTGKLPDATINKFIKWINMGAPDPRVAEVKISDPPKLDLSEEALWSFRPITDPTPPEVTNQEWPRDPLDHFILAKLESAKHLPAADASGEVLAKRIYFDLVGLAPDYNKLRQFLSAYQEDKEQAVTQLVDELLASPQFGERWGRHWLDVARYGESNGDDGLGRNATFPHAWRYRDYVIEAFNNDVPYDQFLKEQIAGDLLPMKTAEQRNRQLTATGFLAIGYKPAKAMNNTFDMDVVDDQINVVSTGVMGLSVACARCHDHKHDPISTRDYYALAGIFTSTETLWGKAGNEPLTAHATELHELRETLDAPEQSAAPPAFAKSYTSRVHSLEPVCHAPLDDAPKGFTVDKGVAFSPETFATLDNGRFRSDTSVASDNYTITFWFRNDIKNNQRAITTYLFSHAAEGDPKRNGDHLGIMGTFDNKNIGKLFIWNGDSENESLRGSTVIPPGVWNHVVLIRSGRKVTLYLNGISEPEIQGESAAVAPDNRGLFFGARSDSFAPLKGSLAHLTVFDRAVKPKEAQDLFASSGQSPGTLKALVPDYAMGVREARKIADCKIHIGGTIKLGPIVKRGFLPASQIAAAPPAIPPDASGRLELAQWLTQGDHPQTARVMVNRIWLHLFGRGIVTTADDFGVYGARPSHPELLDHLATRFTSEGWSMKQIIRSIILSRTYQLSSQPQETLSIADPDNILLGYHSRRRLDAESLRDRMLQASGNLDLNPAEGSAIDQTDALLNWPLGESGFTHQPSNHRSVYLCMLRDALPTELTAFDFPEGRKITGQRDVTTVPAQTLFLLNSPFVIEQSKALAKRLLVDKGKTDEDRVRVAYQYCLQRQPTPTEIKRALAYINEQKAGLEKDLASEAWTSFTQALLASTEFRYVD